MPISHQKLIKLMQSLKLGNEQGLCAGIVEMGINAFLSDQFVRYLDRLDQLDWVSPEELAKKSEILYSKLHNTETKKLIELKKPEKDRLIDTLAFFEGVELYLSPYNHSDLFHRVVAQSETDRITPFVQSKALKDRGGRVDIKLLTGIYNEAELNQWFYSLHKAIKDNPPAQNFALSLGAEDHKLSLCYSAKKDQWTMIDASNLDAALHPINHTQLAKLIFSAFGNRVNTTFYSIVTTTGNNEKYVSNMVNNWMKQIEPLQKITPEKAQRYTEHHNSLVYMASSVGDVATLKELALKKADLDKALFGTVTPMFVAAQNGQADSVRALIKNKADLDKPRWDGVTPLYIATQQGNTEVVRLLVENKANVNIPSSDETYPVFVAAQNAKTEILHLLIDNKADLHGYALDDRVPLSVEDDTESNKKINAEKSLATSRHTLHHKRKALPMKHENIKKPKPSNSSDKGSR